MIKRRKFILWGLLGSIFAKITSRKSAVAIENEIEIASPSQFYQVGTIEQLQTEGFLLNEDLEIGPVLVKETLDNSLIAIDPTCTHAGCFVEWEDTENAFVCPCHQSKFEQDGTLIEGLAISDLIKYELKVESDIIWVASPLEGESM